MQRNMLYLSRDKMIFPRLVERTTKGTKSLVENSMSFQNEMQSKDRNLSKKRYVRQNNTDWHI